MPQHDNFKSKQLFLWAALNNHLIFVMQTQQAYLEA